MNSKDQFNTIGVRDYIAVQAAVAVLSNDDLRNSIVKISKKSGRDSEIEIFKFAYEFADTLIKESNFNKPKDN